MSLTTKTRNIIIGVFIAILALLITGYIIGHKIAVNAANASKQALNKEITRLTTVISDKTVYITQIEQDLKTIRQAKSDGDVTNEELRKLNIKTLNELTRAKITIDTLLANVGHNGGIVVVHDTIPAIGDKNAILLPFTFGKQDAWLNLKGTFNSQGILDVSLKLDFGVDVWSGISKDTKKPIAKITTDCPYINTLSINSIKMDNQVRKKYGIGVQIGWGVNISNPVKVSPYIGLGIQYSIFQF